MDLEKLVLPLEVADKAFKTGLAAGIAGVTALVGAMGAAIKMTFDWAGELDSIGDVMDVTNEQAAAFGFIARKSGVATESFTKAVVIMSKGLVKADGSLDSSGKSLESWGISVKDANGNLKSQTTLMNDISKKYSTFATQQEKVNFLTEVFGKSGADMVDFFDVLAKEGGMDAVTEKVKAFGLAIDPARYETFTRNLEELKLIGTGLAVTFTETLMPALENIMTWFGNFAAADPAQKFEMMKNTIHDMLGGLFNLTDTFKNNAAEIDWAGLSQQLADGINNIDWNMLGIYIRGGVLNVLQGIETIISEINWQALADAVGLAVADVTAGMFGYTDWAALGVDFNKGMDSVFGGLSSFTLTWQGFVDALKAIWQGFLDFIASTKEQALASPGRNVQGGWNSAGTGGNTDLGSNQMVTSPGRNVQGGQHRASGGMVIAGQQYKTAGFGESGMESFTPSVNGRVDPLGGGTSELLRAIQNNRMDENKLARSIVIALKQGMAN